MERPMGPINPFEAAFLGAAFLAGSSVLLGIGDSAAVQQALQPHMVVFWAALLATGGAVSIAGLMWPGSRWTGVEVKRVGLITVGVGSLTYGLSAAFLGDRGVPTAIFHLSLATACAIRVWQVTRRLGEARSHLGGGHPLREG